MRYLLAGSIFFGAVGVIAAAANRAISDMDRPSYEVMRAHIISTKNDDAIRQARRDAEADFVAYRNRRDEESRRDAAAAAEVARQCVDFVYRERNPSACGRGSALFLDSLPSHAASVEDFYETRIMGRCRLVATIREAREAGCLPPVSR